ncbi:MAG: helix-turn-helix domain-containing protein [Actinomycetia bacterium]|nr:helix-turn-helix domain-containing protein [Actinomycetes bacterium]
MDLNKEEQVLLHLAGSGNRTIRGMVTALSMPYTTAYHVVERLERDGAARKDRSQTKKWNTRNWTPVESLNGSWLWELTENGKLLAGAIRERCQIESPDGDAI